MIPKIIHYCWLSSDPYPELILKCMSSWNLLEGYEFVKWDLSKFDINKYPYLKDCFDKKLYAFISDYIRLYAIYNYGGIYLDTDVEVLKPFDNKLLDRPYLIGKNERRHFLNATIIGCEKGNPVIGKILKYYEDNLLSKPIDYVHNDIMEYELVKAIGDDYDKLDCISSDLICPLPTDKKVKNIYCIHYAASGWVEAIYLLRNEYYMELNKKKRNEKIK